MFRVSETVAPLNEQDCKISKTSMIAVKNRNGHTNLTTINSGVRPTDESCNSSQDGEEDFNDVQKTEPEKVINGLSVDRSVYEYCRQIINKPISRGTVDCVPSPEPFQNNIFNESSRSPSYYRNDLDFPGASPKSDNLLRKPGNVIRKKKIKDLPALIPIEKRVPTDSNLTVTRDITNTNTSASVARSFWSDENSSLDQEGEDVALDFSMNAKPPILNDSIKKSPEPENEETPGSLNLPQSDANVNSALKNELKNPRGPKAKKTLIAHSNAKEDATFGSQGKLNDAETSKLPTSVTSDKNVASSYAESSNQTDASSSALAGMTIKVNVLESALGLSTKSFSQLDAKTFDRIVLSVFQHKGVGQARKSGIGIRASAKFGSTSRHANRRIGSAFMTENLHSPQQSPVVQQLHQTPSSLACDNSVKKSGFLAKKSSVSSLFSSSFKGTEGSESASDSVDSDSWSSANCFPRDSLSTSFVQKARKSSQPPWSSYKSSFRSSGKDTGSDASTDLNCHSNISESSIKTSSFVGAADKNGDCASEADDRACMQTRQSYKRKCSNLTNFDGDTTFPSVKREEVLGEQPRGKKIKISEFLVPMSRPSTRQSREVSNHQNLELERNDDKSNFPSCANNHSSESPALSEVPSCDPVHLCCCLMPGVINSMVTKCQAIDSFDGKAIGCSRKVVNFEMLRPSANISFKALCEEHRKKLEEHQCCPGCGLFCTQGNFFECKEGMNQEMSARGEGNFTSIVSPATSTPRSRAVHRFHKHCQIFAADNKCYCPHCFSESTQLEGVVHNTEARTTTFLLQATKSSQDCSENNGSNKSSARLCMSRRGSKNNGSICSDSLNSMKSSVSEDGRVKSSLDFHGLLETFNSDGIKLKKVRPCPKSLCLACKTGDTSKVLYILAEGVDPCLTPEDISQSPIHVAARNGHHDIVDVLLSAGVFADLVDQELHTPLMEASQNGCLSIVDLLIKAGCSVDARAHDGMTALHLAAKSGRREIIRALLDTRKVDINTQDDGGWTSLIWATEHGHKECIGFLLLMGANPNSKDNELNTALHWAAFTGNEDIIAMLLDAGCFIDDINDHGDTPLHIAARQDHFKCVEVLIWRSANIWITNKLGVMPVECCLEGRSKSAQHLKLVDRLPRRPKEKIITRDISRGRESCPIMAISSISSEDAPLDFQYILGYVETSPINVNRLVTSLQVCSCIDNCSSSASCSCSRSSTRRWYDENGRLSNDFNFLEPPLIFECNMLCSCRATCLNRVVQLGTTNNLQVFRTDGRGWGCRTLRDISKGTFVCEYAGELITDEEANRREDDSYLFDLDFQDSETYCIDAARYGNVSRFINHLCEPNVIPVKVFVDHQDLRFPRICFFASKDIKAFDELGFDYGYKFWSIKWKYFTCTCGSQNCRYSKDTILKTIEEYNRAHAEETSEE